MPSARQAQVAPASRVSHTPPHETPIRTTRQSRGSTQMEWIAGHSVPPPIHCWRLGSSHRERISSQLAPWSRERKSPPGMVPHHRRASSSGPPVQREYVDEAVGNVLAPAVPIDEPLGLLRIGGRRDFLPAAVLRAVQLDAEVTVVEDGVVKPAPAVAEREGDVVAQEVGRGDAPLAALTLEPNRPFRVETLSRSLIGAYPPDKACRTEIELIGEIASLIRTRSRSGLPSTTIAIWRRSAD